MTRYDSISCDEMRYEKIPKQHREDTRPTCDTSSAAAQLLHTTTASRKHPTCIIRQLSAKHTLKTRPPEHNHLHSTQTEAYKRSLTQQSHRRGREIGERERDPWDRGGGSLDTRDLSRAGKHQLVINSSKWSLDKQTTTTETARYTDIRPLLLQQTTSMPPNATTATRTNEPTAAAAAADTDHHAMLKQNKYTTSDTKNSATSKKAMVLKRKTKKGGLVTWLPLILTEVMLIGFLYMRMKDTKTSFPDPWGLWLGIRGHNNN